ncbi:MAG TPA: sulfatase [Puia sp.]|nr:sulfatase [Puia sp.]
MTSSTKHAILLFFLLITTAVNAQQKKPNIIWITCEDISPYIGAYGDPLVKTPNIDQLAREGVRYLNAYTAAGVCAPSRSSIITGMYPTSIGTQHMRTIGDPKYQPVPSYSAVIPEYVKCFPEYLRKNGYYCTNNEKQDYQFIPPVTVWDENSSAASYRNRPADKPFFAVYNLFITHESQLFGRKDSLLLDSNLINVPPYYPDTRIVRHDMDRLFTNIERMDNQVGEIIKMLKDVGLYDNTYIFFYSDHGGALPWMKREILERGTHIPLIIHFPGNKNAGTVNDDLISETDFAPTVLSLAGIPVPDYMQGQAFLGDQTAKTKRKYVFAARDRMDTEYDRVRMVRDKQYQYLYNYMPEKPYYQNIEYRLSIAMMREFLQLRDEGKLNSIQMGWFKTKPVEELYDVKNDPHELHNLVNDAKYKTKLDELRKAFQGWTRKVGDMGAIGEKDMIKQMWNGGQEAPTTDTPTITKVSGGINIQCKTKGASIGYRIIKQGSQSKPEMHVVQSWDFGYIFGAAKNGTLRPAEPAWKVYNGNTLPLIKGDTLVVNAMRIGYKPAVVKYVSK